LFFGIELLFLLRFFPGSNGFAQAAGMQPVEGFGHGGVNGAGFEIAREHRRPGDRLQQGPVRAEGGYERNNNQNFASLDKHMDKLVNNFTKSTLANP
jgi:hypothetical protein